MDESQKHNVVQNKSGMKEHTVYDFIYIDFKNRQNSSTVLGIRYWLP